MIVSIDSGVNKIDDRDRNKKKVRLCVQKSGDVSGIYYREEEMRVSSGPHCV